MNAPPILAAIVLAVSLDSGAYATDRYYHDSFSVSPNGRYRIDAKSPDNAGEHPRPFAANFVYTLTDATTKKALWQRKQPMTRGKGSPYASPTEGSPVEVYVNDAGVVVARLSRETLLVLDPKDGHKRAEVEVLQAFPKEEFDVHVSMSTAGPIWSQDSDWFFVDVPAEKGNPAGTYFVVRPYWNHRLVIDMATGTHVALGTFHSTSRENELTAAPREVARLLPVIMREEARRAMASLAGAAESLAKDQQHKSYWDVRAALHTVVFLRLQDAEPSLRALEAHVAETEDRGGSLRVKVREALRAIGKKPVAGYGVRLFPMVNRGGYLTHDAANPMKAHVPVDERAANAGKIATGMSVKELTDLLGCPDAEIRGQGNHVDYDLDAPASYTLRVGLDRMGERIESVRMITPYAFLHDPARLGGY